MLRIRCPRDDRRTRYVLETVFSGRDADCALLVDEDRSDVLVELIGQDSGARLPAATQSIDASLLPLLRIAPEKLADARPDDPDVEAAIAGPLLSAIFHVLAGTEESVSAERDQHDRFPASASRIFAAGYDTTPFVDLWLELLIGWIEQRLQVRLPDLPAWVVRPTHDVDAPYRFRFQSVTGLTRLVAGDLARANISAALSSMSGWLAARRGTEQRDPFDHFDWMMAQAETVGSTCTFYIIAGHSGGRMDGDYDIHHPDMMRLWEKILRRGHRIGVHPSYNSYRSADVLKQEHERVLSLLRNLGVQTEALPVRMHYLRFDPRLTPSLLAEAGFSSDSTLGFADRSGFRRGTSRPFRLWDLERDRPLDLEERPLIAMDATLLRPSYENLDREPLVARIDRLAYWCGRAGGEMTILWHNNYFSEPWHFEAYRSILITHAAAAGARQVVQ